MDFFKIQVTAAGWRATSWGHCIYDVQTTPAAWYNYAGWDLGQQAPVSIFEFCSQMAFFAQLKWQRPDGGPLARAIADMPYKCRQWPDITMLAG